MESVILIAALDDRLVRSLRRTFPARRERIDRPFVRNPGFVLRGKTGVIATLGTESPVAELAWYLGTERDLSAVLLCRLGGRFSFADAVTRETDENVPPVYPDLIEVPPIAMETATHPTAHRALRWLSVRFPPHAYGLLTVPDRRSDAHLHRTLRMCVDWFREQQR